MKRIYIKGYCDNKGCDNEKRIGYYKDGFCKMCGENIRKIE